MVGTRLGKFRIEAEISSGGMGTIYRAADAETGHVVALKVLKKTLASDRLFLQRFRREVSAMQRVDHPNVVRIYDVGSCGDVHYYAMEHMHRSLTELLRQGTVEVPRALQIASQIARGLSAVHAAGICHRDVKPSNILFDAEGNAKIADFGIAKVSDATRVTQTGVIVGTPTYMAPEQVEDTGVGPRADIYSLGVVLYEMLVGRPPFEGHTTLDILRKHRYTLPEPPKSFKPRLPAALSHLVVGMLAKEASKRPATMGMVADALDHLAHNIADEARRPGRRGPARDLSSTQLGERYERAAARVALWGKALVGVVAVALLGYVSYRVVDYLCRGPADYLRQAQALEARDRAGAMATYQALIRRYPKAPEAGAARRRAQALLDDQRREAAERARIAGGGGGEAAIRAQIAYIHYCRAEKAAEAGDAEHACRIYRMVRQAFADTPWGARADRRLQELKAKGPASPGKGSPVPEQAQDASPAAPP